MKLAPCLELFFKELPFPERIAKVREAGFDAAEFWHHTGKDLPAIAAACRQHNVVITSIVGTRIHPGPNDPAQHAELTEMLKAAIAAAQVIGCQRLIVLSGNTLPRVSRIRQTENIITWLGRVAPLAEEADVTLVLENLNTLCDHPGYFLASIEETAQIIRRVGHPRVKALIDIYHAGIMEGNLVEKIRDTIDTIGHFHAAGIPGRHEITEGEQNYPVICRAIDALGYNGYMGLEYTPLKDPMTSLIEARRWIKG